MVVRVASATGDVRATDRSTRRLDFDVERCIPGGQVGDVVIAEHTGHDGHHFVLARAGAVSLELRCRVDGRLAGQVRRIRRGGDAQGAMTHATHLRLGAPGLDVTGHQGAGRQGKDDGREQAQLRSTHLRKVQGSEGTDTGRALGPARAGSAGAHDSQGPRFQSAQGAPVSCGAQRAPVANSAQGAL